MSLPRIFANDFRLLHCVICPLLIVLLFFSIGCDVPRAVDSATDKEQEEATLQVDGPLRVVVLDDESLGNVLQREWRSISDYEIEVSHQTTKDFFSQLDTGKKRLDSDVVIFPCSLLGQLAEQRLLRPIVNDATTDAQYRNGEIFNLIRRRETQWNRQPYAMSFGSPVLVLIRRTDMVPDAPETWKELGETIDELKKTLPKDVNPLMQPMSEGWPARLLVARAASYLYDNNKLSSVFEYASLKPRITSEAFVRAGKELALQSQSVEQGGEFKERTPQSVLQEFLDGNAAMAITLLSSQTKADSDTIDFPIAISDLPGSRVRYVGSDDAPETVAASNESTDEVRRVTVHGLDGRLGAITRSAKNAALANIFLVWATGPEQSLALCARSGHTAPFRLSHEAGAKNWVPSAITPEVAAQYLAISKTALNRAAAMQFPRLPGQHRYVAELDDAVHRMFNGVSAKQSLATAVETWNAISFELDLEKQKSSYRRSLGINAK